MISKNLVNLDKRLRKLLKNLKAKFKLKEYMRKNIKDEEDWSKRSKTQWNEYKKLERGYYQWKNIRNLELDWDECLLFNSSTESK